MSRFALKIASITFVVFVISINSFQAQGVKRYSQEKNEPASLPAGFYLGKVAMKYNCSLTFEEAWQEGEPRNHLEVYSVPIVSNKKDLLQELEYVRRNVPFFSYEITEGSPRIIHIRDTRLLSRDGYGMNRVINNLDFKGTVNDLLKAIGKQGIPIEPESAFLLGGNEFPDRTTEVQLKGESLTVREALTKAIAPKRQHLSILWIARTKLTEDLHTTIYVPWAGKTP